MDIGYSQDKDTILMKFKEEAGENFNNTTCIQKVNREPVQVNAT
jgi:hypothetical protein